MARKHFTLLLVSDDDATIRQYRLRTDVLRVVAGAVLLVAGLVASLGAGALVDAQRGMRAAKLERENALLGQELEQLRSRVGVLATTVDELARKDTTYRLLAGLDPLAEGVQQAGIGGPGTVLQRSTLLHDVNRRLGDVTAATASDVELLLRRARLLSSSWAQASSSLELEHARLLATPSILPTAGEITSSFSARRWHPILDRPRPHVGMDITAPRGTKIRAAANGRVSFVGRSGDYGLTVEIDHGFGYLTRYAHQSRTLVRQGQSVQRGDVIGEVGATGLAVGPHLHYEVLVNGEPVNPGRFVLPAGVLPD